MNIISFNIIWFFSSCLILRHFPARSIFRTVKSYETAARTFNSIRPVRKKNRKTSPLNSRQFVSNFFPVLIWKRYTWSFEFTNAFLHLVILSSVIPRPTSYKNLAPKHFLYIGKLSRRELENEKNLHCIWKMGSSHEKIADKLL